MNPSTSLGTRSNVGMAKPSPPVRQAGNIGRLLVIHRVCRRSVPSGCPQVKYRCRCRVIDPIALVNDWIWHGINMDFFEQGRCYSSPLQGEFNLFSGISSMYRENTSRFKTGFE